MCVLCISILFTVCESISLFLSYHRIPLFPLGCTSPDLGDKSQYDMLMRVNAVFNKMGKAFAEIFTYYNWTRAVMMASVSYLQTKNCVTFDHMQGPEGQLSQIILYFISF